VDVIIMMTRHDTPAERVIRALTAGKQVFMAMPLAMILEGVTQRSLALEVKDPTQIILSMAGVIGTNLRWC
jgi:predicted dehydrogenase